MISTVNHYSAYNYFSSETRVRFLRANVGVTQRLPKGHQRRYFEITGLLCWRNDSVYISLRSHLAYALAAYRFCWRAARNHCRLAFVGFDSDRLSRAWLQAWGAHSAHVPYRRDAYPRFLRHPGLRLARSCAAPKHESPRGIGYARDARAYEPSGSSLGAPGPSYGLALARYLRFGVGHPFRTGVPRDPGQARNRDRTPSSDGGGRTERGASCSSRPNPVTAAYAIARTVNEATGIAGSRASHQPFLAQAQARATSLHVGAVPGGYYSNPDADFRNRTNLYNTRGVVTISPSVYPGFNRRSGSNAAAKRNGPPPRHSMAQQGPIEGTVASATRRGRGANDDPIGTIVSRVLAAEHLAGSSKGVRVTGPGQRLEHVIRPRKSITPAVSPSLSAADVTAGVRRGRGHWVIQDQARRVSRELAGVNKLERVPGSYLRHATPTARQPRLTAVAAGRYRNDITRASSEAYRQFVVNPNLSQADLVVFANPTLTPSLLKQARQLGIPTLGLHSALRSAADARRVTGNPGLSFGILGNPNNGWLSFNLGANLLKLNRRA